MAVSASIPFAPPQRACAHEPGVTHTTLPQRVLFGSGRGAEHLEAEVRRLDAQRVMGIAGERELEMARGIASRIDVALWHDEVEMHVPVEVAERGRAAAAEHGIDLLVSVGGGSTTGLAKAIVLISGVPIRSTPRWQGRRSGP